MSELFKNYKFINSMSGFIKALSILRGILTVVIIAFSVITGAKYILAAGKIE